MPSSSQWKILSVIGYLPSSLGDVMGLKILHIADLHWRGITRHDEYVNAFKMLFDHIKSIRPDILFVGGDIFHTKTQGISPEVIEKMVWMFREFGNLVPTHVILGNHDGNLANEDRQDAISPLLHALEIGRAHV